MSDDGVEFLTTYWKEQRDQARQCETQRAALTNIVLVVFGVSVGFVAQKGFQLQTLAVSIPIGLLGIYGVLATIKYYERFGYHNLQARAIYTRIKELQPAVDFDELAARENDRHRSQNPKAVKLRLYVIWLGLHWTIVLAGATFTTLSIVLS